MDKLDSKNFYFDKQVDYSKYRPTYALELFKFLHKEYMLSKNSVVIELGAGTGKFAKIISKYCKMVYCIEPNNDMISQGIKYCKGSNNIKYIKASAENTLLDEGIADFVFAVQSFHWFNKEETKIEVQRILKKNAWFAIIWNDCVDENNEFSKIYFDYINDWNNKITNKPYRHKNLEERKNFFKNGLYESKTFIHTKMYTIEMLIGLSKSLSFAPKENEKFYNEFINGVEEIFNKYQTYNKVKFDFHTEIYIGKV